MDGGRDAYGRIARWYEPALRPVVRPLWGIGAALCPPGDGMRVLDIGCGTGGQLAAYAEAGCEVHGVDTSLAMLEQARERLGGIADLELVDHGAPLPFAGGSFDLVLLTLVLHEMSGESQRQVLREAARMIGTSGEILVIDYSAEVLRFPKGTVWRGVTHGAEFAAGRRHYRNFRAFTKAGGLAPPAADTGLEVRMQKLVAGGNVGLYVLRRSD